MSKKKKTILLSFVGTNDAGKFKGPSDGAILTALTNEKFDEVILLWNKSGSKEIDFLAVSNYLKNEIKKRRLAKKTKIVELPIKDVTDHNQIYLALKEFTDKLVKTEDRHYTSAISSGTPAMQVCWILLAESGDFSEANPLRLIKIKDPKFGKSENVFFKISTSLPRIVRLKEEVDTLKKDLIPIVTITISRPGLKIGDTEIVLTPIELTYFKYFAERVIEDKGDEKFPMYSTTNTFLDRVIQIHQEFFPESESSRMELISMRRKKIGLAISTFRGNISKLNKKIVKSLQNDSIANTFKISAEGIKGAKFYGIKAPKEKIKIVKWYIATTLSQ